MKSGKTELFSKILRLNPEVAAKVGDVVNGFSKFTILGRTVNAVICVKCNEVDANFGPRENINLVEYKAHLHECTSIIRQRHEVKVKIVYLVFKHIFEFVF